MAESLLRSGAWVDADRIRNYSRILILLTALSVTWLLATSHGFVMDDRQPVGTDFYGIYSAGVLAQHNAAALAYDWPTHREIQQQLILGTDAFYGWCYPPPFLLIAGLLALFSYPLALLLWQAATLAFYLFSQRVILRPATSEWLLPSLGFTGVFINLLNGHNGFLSAALFGMGLALLRTRPFIAGLLLGALCYKPQFGLLIPLALIAGRQGKAFIGASISVIALCLAATLAYGEAIWPAFFASLEPTRVIVLEQGDTGWYKIQSLFSFIRALGGSVPLAYAIHGAIAIAVAVVTACAWRRHGAHPLSCALLITGSLIVTPYVLDYDLTMLAPAIAFLAVHGLNNGFASYQRSLLALAWCMPLLARITMQHVGIPLGFLTVFLLFAHTAYWARQNSHER